MKQLSQAKGIPVEILEMASAADADGFNTNGSINWPKFSEWYELHKDELVKSSLNSLEYFKTQIAKRDVQIRDEQLKKMRGESLSPDEVKEFLTRVGKAQAKKLFSCPDEINPKLEGLDEAKRLAVLKDSFSTIANFFFQELDKWI